MTRFRSCATPFPTSPAALVVACMSALALPLAATAAAPPGVNRAQPAVPEPLTLRTAEGRLEFLLDTPDAASSLASRSNVERFLAPGAAPHPLTPGYTIHARVIVRCADQALLADVAKNQRATLAPFDPAGRTLQDFYVLTTQSVRSAAAVADLLAANPQCLSVELDALRPRSDRTLPSDPGVPQQWYISNTAAPLFDLNVEPAWDLGFTGTGVVVGMLEGGFDAAHPDLAPNFSAALSQPANGFSSHGTATAGLVAMAANNNAAGAGVAYGASLARLYYGSDSETAASFLFQLNPIHIKNNSWGPTDNGNIAFIASVELAALQSAYQTGRNGLGTVFTWSAGNGGQNADRVDYDPYASSRFVISIGAVGNDDLRAVYSEPGASLMLVAPSSNDFFLSNSSGIYTTTPGLTGVPATTSSFGGTSASAPIGAGAIALMLQARPDLTARDVAHVLIRSARKCNPTSPAWSTNGAGLWQNENFGFGAIDAAAAVSLAQTWTLRPPELEYSRPLIGANLPIPDNDTVGASSSISIPANMLVERVQVVLNAPHARIGDLRIELTSPAGTSSLLAQTRSDFTPGYNNYTFTTVRHWDEAARGTWTINISDRAAGATGTFSSWSLLLIGSRPICPCDWNRSGSTSVQDLFDFLTDWFAGAADFNNSGAVTVQDIFDYLDCWFAPPSGC